MIDSNQQAACMLDVQNVYSGYGKVPILSGISLTVGHGEFVGILGHNGMGKTTLLRTLMGYIPASSGAVLLDGHVITQYSPTQRAHSGIGYVPQGREIFPNLSVLDNLRIGCLLSKKGEKETIDAILAEFPRLTKYLDRLGGALSGGEQQLLALARCLCAGPRLIFLDEPTEGIQPSIIEEMIDTLKDIGKRYSLTILLVEQNLKFISSLSERILILQKGAITAEISPQMAADRTLIDEFVGMA